MSQPLTSKIALITGSTKGIGAATAQHLHSLGAKVVINYSSPDPTAANALVDKLGGPDHTIAIRADASNVSDISRLVDETVTKWGRIDIVVANAGILPMKDIESVSEEDFQRAVDVNVKGPMFLCQVGVFRALLLMS